MVTPSVQTQRTLVESMSFYVPASSFDVAMSCAKVAGAVTLKGPNGPVIAQQMRADGWEGAVLLDRGGYESRSAKIDPAAWAEAQSQVGADRLLSPGRWVPWTKDPSTIATAVSSELAVVERWDSPTLVLAIDHRWLTNGEGYRKLLETLGQMNCPVALVLANPGDPLSPNDAVNSLVHLCTSIDQVSILRCDHGAIGAVAFGAVHGSIGLMSTYRHFVPQESSGGGIPGDRTVRLFVLDLMDWFTASTVAGWSTTKVSPTCDLACCNGQRLDRFLDERLKAEAELHNKLALWKLVEYTLDSRAEEPRFAFPNLCAKAVQRYGQVGGFTNVIEPKAQLVQWASLAR